MNKLRFLLLLSISILLLCLIERGYHFATDGFAIHRISHLEPPPPFNKVVLWDEEAHEEIDKALKQDYYYLGCGSQCFVFSSADNQYVLKFFKHHQWRFTGQLSRIWLSSPFCKKRKEKKRRRKYTSYLDACRSYCLSFEHFKDKTGLLFVHLSTNSSGLPTVTIRDRIYRKYNLPLDNFTFLLQRKATPLGQYIRERTLDAPKIRSLITKYLTFIEERAKLGYLNKDPSFTKNFGIKEDTLIEIDIGGCFHDPKKDLHYFYSEELTKIEEKLCILFKKNRSLCMFIRQEIQRRRDSFSGVRV